MTLPEAMAGLRAAIDAKRNGPTHGDGAPVVLTLTSHPTGWSAEAVTVYGVRVLDTGIVKTPWGALGVLGVMADRMEVGK
jgi:hypothetical protein